MNGLRRVGNFDEALAQANKDDAFQTGTISVTLQNHARNIVNNPEFQRVRDRLQDNLQQSEIRHIQEKEFQHNITNIAVDARINRNDLDYIVNNLQPQAPPPAPPPPPRDDAADRERLLAELDGRALEREKQMRAEMVAQRNAMQLAASRTETIPQQIINNYHQHVSPAPMPTPIVNNNVSIEAARHTGHSVHHLFLKMQPPAMAAEMPTTRPPPPPPPGAGAVAAPVYSLPAPRQADGRPPPPPSRPPAPGYPPPPPPVQQMKAVPPVPTVLNLKLKRKKKKKNEEEVAANVTDAPPSAPSAGSERIRVGKRGDANNPALGPGIQFGGGAPFGGRGNNLSDAGHAFSGLSGNLGRQGGKLLMNSSYQPFVGQGQRLQGDPVLRNNAAKRMQEIGHQREQRRRGAEMIDRRNDMGRALRRRGEQGDVVPLGKRKNSFDQRPFSSRQRTGPKYDGPQRFTIG